MRKDGDGGPSFDPRTWAGRDGKAAPPPSDRTSESSDSFDPRSWGKAAPAPPPTVPPGPPKAPSEPAFAAGPPSQPPQTRDRATIAAAMLATIAILGAGAAAAVLTRAPPAAPVAATPVADAPAPVAPEPGGEGSRTLQVADAAGVADALLAAGIDPEQAQAAAAGVTAVLGKKPGEIRLAFTQITTSGGAGARLTRLEATGGDGSGVRLTATPEGIFRAEPIKSTLKTEIDIRSGEMDNSTFYNAAVKAGVIDSLVSDFAAAFSFDFDFQQEIPQGSVFEAGFERSVNAAGEPFGDPRLVYAYLHTSAKTRQFYRFTPPGETAPGWFDANGRSIVRSLMRTPIDGARVTSKFGYRVHPILGYTKLHGGTDFGAPAGTPIYAAGDGLVQVASLRGAAGNMVQILHDNGWVTHYFHMSRFGDGIVVGVRVKQGQMIGAVGTTGRSTGPHLHYEVLIDGQKVDPLGIDTGTGVTLSGPALKAFMSERDRIDRSRAKQGQ